ncbi:MAG: alpha/beta fold hydrolase [Phyllobacteriaceae bacterium]|nr:alpha/beta fold hydrolase [Phyllobacteriaceae bacterium]
MSVFHRDGFDIDFLDEGVGAPVVLVHGFASNKEINWVGPGWVSTLKAAGKKVIAFDNRGHGRTTKSYVQADYHPALMAGDTLALATHLGIDRFHLFGYSMGARIAAFTALAAPDRVASLILGGLGAGLVDGVGDWDPIADALLAADRASVWHERGRMFRAFADRTGSDRRALAACISRSRELVTRTQAAGIAMPTLIGVGTKDDIAGDPGELAALLPNAEAFPIVGRDHMLAVGDERWKAKVVAFLAENAP